jgi:hypothetical protein
MVIENRDLAVGTKLVAKYKGEQWKIEVLPGAPRTYGFVGKRPKDAAQVYKTPSAAGSAVMGGTACNGWRFWSVEGATGSRQPPLKDRPRSLPTTRKAPTRPSLRCCSARRTRPSWRKATPADCAMPASST